MVDNQPNQTHTTYEPRRPYLRNRGQTHQTRGHIVPGNTAMNGYLSTMTVEERPNGDPLDHLIWGGLSLQEGGLPPLGVPGMRFLVPGPWSERRRRAFSGVAQTAVRSLQARLEDVSLGADNLLFGEEQANGGWCWRPLSAQRVSEVAGAFDAFLPLLTEMVRGPDSHSQAPRPAVSVTPAAAADVSTQTPDPTSFCVVQLKTRHESTQPAERLNELRNLIESVSHTLEALIDGGSTEVQTSVHPGNAVIQGTSPADLAAARRVAFMARGWPTATELAARMGSTSTNPSQYTSRLRREKKLFGVWSTQDGGTYIHPDFQFREGDMLSPNMPALMAALEAIPGFSDNPKDVRGGDPGRWRRLFWLYTPRSELSARSLAEAALYTQGHSALDALTTTGKSDATPRAPADVWREAPDAVIALARNDADDDRTGV